MMPLSLATTLVSFLLSSSLSVASPAPGEDGIFPLLQARAPKVECGPGKGSCKLGFCCSTSGWCGVGDDFCSESSCQPEYSVACQDL